MAKTKMAKKNSYIFSCVTTTEMSVILLNLCFIKQMLGIEKLLRN